MGQNKDFNTQTPPFVTIYFFEKCKSTIITHHNLPGSQAFASIDWEGIDLVSSYLSLTTNISKFVTHFLPVGKNVHRRGSWQEPHCPLCEKPVETASHINAHITLALPFSNPPSPILKNCFIRQKDPLILPTNY